MNARNLATAAFTFALSVLSSLAVAGEIKPFSQQEFDQLNNAGQSVVLDVTAPWCSVCKQQKPIVENLMKQPAYKDVTLMTIDFDSSKAILKNFKVTMQSTLIAFKGGKEVGRSIGDTTPSGLEALIKKAVN